jgi:hypothetical protein
MRLFRSLLLIGCLCSLTSCATRDEYGVEHIKTTMQKEMYVHAPSQFRFPPGVAGFNRGSAYAHGPQGMYVWVGYRNDKAGIFIMVDVRPTRQFTETFEEHYARRRDELPARYPSAKRISEDVAQIAPDGIRRSGLHATHTYTDYFQGDLRPLISEFFLFSEAGQYITYRVTYRADRLMVVKAPMQAFMEELAWPPRKTIESPPRRVNVATGF